MVRLNIPYRSQWDTLEANEYNADCGPTCAAMILNYHHIPSSSNSIYADNFPEKGKKEFTNFTELIGVFKKHDVPVAYRQSSNQEEALFHLRANIDAGKPLIALVKYQPWREHEPIGSNQFNGGHFVVVTGYDDEHIYMHDPLFGLWVTPASKGSHYAMPTNVFCAGWSGFDLQNNPNWAYLLLGAGGEPHPEPVAPPEVDEEEPVQPPAPIVEEPLPEIPAGVKTMDDVERRIRALAAYRWAHPPDFGDETAVSLWREHLGDWGLTYQEHIVQPGDSYVSLAQRTYGEAHRWEAIRAYNRFAHEGLWVGETVLLPNLGSSGAHLHPALPKDTIHAAGEFGDEESFMIEGIDPYESALDYDSLWDDAISLGPVEPEKEE